MRKIKKLKYDCSLFPYEVEEFVTLQNISNNKQKEGWGIELFKIPEIWGKTKGEGVKIAVLDTGCDLNHEDLKSNIIDGINLVEKNKSPMDDDKNGHGTHVSGIICAENNDVGIIGVAPNAKIMPVKVLNKDGNGNLTTVARGINWSIENKADIIVMSLGSSRSLQSVYKSIKIAYKKNIPCFVAAGNMGMTKEIFYPANYKETIAIGSINEKFNRSKFSNTGLNLDFMAPGCKVLSTTPNNSYSIMSGTSMATPFVAGIAALLLSYSRNSSGININSVEDYRNIFKENSISIKNESIKDDKFYQGFGAIDAINLFNLF